VEDRDKSRMRRRYAMKESKTEKTDITEKKMIRLSEDDLMHVSGGVDPIVTDNTGEAIYIDVPDEYLE
jgi:hypothetical protein